MDLLDSVPTVEESTGCLAASPMLFVFMHGAGMQCLDAGHNAIDVPWVALQQRDARVMS